MKCFNLFNVVFMCFFVCFLFIFVDCLLDGFFFFNFVDVWIVCDGKLFVIGIRFIGFVVIRGRWFDWLKWYFDWSLDLFNCLFILKLLGIVVEKCRVFGVGLVVVVFDEWNELLKF